MPCTLSGCTGTEAAGVVTFSGCKVTTPGTAYQLTASDGLLAAATTAAFNVAGAATQLVVTTQPVGATGGSAFATQPVVAVEDASGSVVTTDSSSVTLAITAATPISGGPGALTGCDSTESAGIVSFSGCRISTAGTGYALTATVGTLSAAISAAFNVSVGSPTRLAITTQPAGASGGTAFSTQPVVSIEDAGGNVVTTDSSTVTLAIAASTPSTGGPGTLAGCTGTESSGVVTFTGCRINAVGTAYELTATDGSLASATTGAFNVVAGVATQAVDTTTPGPSTSAVSFTSQPVVTLEDAGGNVATSSTNAVSLAVNSGTGTLRCTTNPVAAVAGVATFAGCKITLGTDGAFTLSATASGLSSVTSAAFTVYGAPSKLAFTTQPVASTGGSALTVQPVIGIEDSSGNVVPTATSPVTLSVTTGTGTLACTTNPVTAVAGYASFSRGGITLGTQGSFNLSAASSGLTTASSVSFAVAGPGTKVVFSTQPVASTGGSQLTAQPAATIEDSSGDVVTTSTASVMLAIATRS